MNASDTLHVACAGCGARNRLPRQRLGDDPQCGRCGQPLLPAAPLEVDDAQFDALVAGTELPVVVDFWAPWCGPCQAMAPQYAQAAAQLKGRALLLKVNSDDNPRAAQRFGIRSVPTLVRLQGGREVARSAGAMPAAGIVAFAAGRAGA